MTKLANVNLTASVIRLPNTSTGKNSGKSKWLTRLFIYNDGKNLAYKTVPGSATSDYALRLFKQNPKAFTRDLSVSQSTMEALAHA